MSKLRFECLATDVPFETIRTLTADAVTRSIDFWANTHDAEALLAAIRRSNGIQALLAALTQPHSIAVIRNPTLFGRTRTSRRRPPRRAAGVLRPAAVPGSYPPCASSEGLDYLVTRYPRE